MSRYYIFFLSIIALFSLNKTLGQTTYYSGNLLRIPFNSVQFNPADTLKSWSERIDKSEYVESHSYKKYFGHIKTPSGGFFLKKLETYSYSPVMQSFFGDQEIEDEMSPRSRRIGYLPTGWDVLPNYMLSRTIISETKNGIWFNNGTLGSAFLANNDSLTFYFYRYSNTTNTTLQDLLLAITGKINNYYLASFFDGNNYHLFNYLLINLDNSPEIDSSKAKKIILTGDSAIVKNPRYHNATNALTRIRNIKGNLYAITPENGQGIHIFNYSDSSLVYLKTVLLDHLSYENLLTPLWEIRNGKLFLFENRKIVSFEFSSSDTTFINEKVVLDNFNAPDYYNLYGNKFNSGIDWNMKYAAVISKGPEKLYKDTLKIFDIDKSVFINTIVLNNIKEPFLPIVDSPYVFVHQINYQYTEVEVFSSVIHDYSLAAYPNPFNASATINYSIPKESHVELKVYDMLGREISTLVNQIQVPGDYKVQFNASSLSSGVYIYSIHAGDYRAGKKLLLLK